MKRETKEEVDRKNNETREKVRGESTIQKQRDKVIRESSEKL